MAKKGLITAERADVLKNLRTLTPADNDTVEGYPTLLDLLSPRFRDGRCTRQGSRLSLKVEGAFFRMSIDCPTEGVMCSMVVGSLYNILNDFERHVAGADACWVPNFDAQKKARPVVT